MLKNQSKSSKNKRKGNSFEREIANILSLWIYGKKSVVRRHPTSGAEKDYGQGADIAVFQPGFEQLDIFIEVKRGYKIDIFNALKQINEWFNIAKEKNKKNYPIWIIWKILNKGIIIASTQKFKNIDELFNINNLLYIYDFKKLIKLDYKNI